MYDSGGEALAVGGGAEPVMGLEATGEFALIRSSDRAADAGDRFVGVQEHDGGVFGAELGQVRHGRQPGGGVEQPHQVAGGEV